MIVLTGTTGNLGSIVLQHLLKLVPPSSIIVSVYNTEGHQKLKDAGVTIRHGDYNKPETLEHAFKGGDKLFLVSSPSMDSNYRIEAHKRAIDAAIKVGIKRIYYTSLAFNNDNSEADVMKAHTGTEKYLKQSGVDYTIIREGCYAAAYPVFLGFFKPGDSTVAVPNDGPVAWVSREDLGEANAKILVSDEYKNETLLLTGPEALTLKESTQVLAKVLNTNIDFKLTSMDEYVNAHSNTDNVAKLWSTSYPAIQQGETGTVSPLLENILKRKPTTFEERLKVLIKEQGEVDNWLKGARQEN
jgi:uncharacterized protein YbjT (DUF2867 family)